MTDKLIITSHDEMNRLKQNALNLMNKLPDDLDEALIVLDFMTKDIEKATGRTIKQTIIKYK